MDVYKHTYTGVGRSRFEVPVENTVINNNTRINSVLCTHNCEPTFAHLCIKHYTSKC